MISISSVQIHPKVLDEIKKRGLTKQFDKAVRYILSGHQTQIHLKLRHPKGDGIWYFRINRQYRAICTVIDSVLYVDMLDNHQ